MDRVTVYPGQVPLETDLLRTNRNTMMAIGRVLQDMLGTGTLVSGLACTPTSPASMQVKIGAGSIYSLQNVDNTAYSSLAADTTNQVVKQGIIRASDNVTLTVTAPGTVGYSQIWLVQAAYADVDGDATILPYYNSSNPAVPYSGPSGTGSTDTTTRAGSISISVKAGTASASPTAPAADAGYTALYTITVAYGQSSVVSGNIATVAGAPFFAWVPSFLSSGSTAAARTALGAAASGDNTDLISLKSGVTIGAAGGSTGGVATVWNTGDKADALVVGDLNTPASITGVYLRSTTTAFLSWGSGGVLSFTPVAGSGTERARFDATGNYLAGVDNTYTLGGSAKRWSTVYAATGTINTSDGREKTVMTALSDAELRAAKVIAGGIGTYQWLASIADKGEDAARVHCGVIAQDVIAALKAEGLDPNRYGFVCYDKWDRITEPLVEVDEATGESRVVGERVWQEAGDRFGIRPDELTFFLIAAQEARLAALENKA